MNEKEKSYYEIDKNDILLSKRNYNSRHVYRNLRLTRETIRYYEKINLLPSLHRGDNGYREYSGKDMSILLMIDAYRHKGYTNSQIKHILKNGSLSVLQQENLKNRQELQKEIERLEHMKQALEDEAVFIENIPGHLFQVSIRDMIPFKIIQRLDSIVNFQNYEENVLPYINERDAILSNMIREVTYDHAKGYLNSQACVIQRCANDDVDVVHSGKAIYSIVENDYYSDSMMKKMFTLEEEYIKLHHLQTKGVIYINTVLQYAKDSTATSYHESWIPII